MSAIEHTTSQAREAVAFRKPLTVVARIVLRVLRRWQRNRVIDELWRLDDRQLRDIGIKRGDIPGLVDRFFREKRELDRILVHQAPVDHVRSVAAQLRRAA